MPDKSVDVVYTAHSLEPNGGRELEAVKELLRITSKRLILIEPSYELADKECKIRMKIAAIGNSKKTNQDSVIAS